MTIEELKCLEDHMGSNRHFYAELLGKMKHMNPMILKILVRIIENHEDMIHYLDKEIASQNESERSSQGDQK